MREGKGSEPPNYYTNHLDRRFFCQMADERERRNERLKPIFWQLIQRHAIAASSCLNSKIILSARLRPSWSNLTIRMPVCFRLQPVHFPFYHSVSPGSWAAVGGGVDCKCFIRLISTLLQSLCSMRASAIRLLRAINTAWSNTETSKMSITVKHGFEHGWYDNDALVFSQQVTSACSDFLIGQIDEEDGNVQSIPPNLSKSHVFSWDREYLENIQGSWDGFISTTQSWGADSWA